MDFFCIFMVKTPFFSCLERHLNSWLGCILTLRCCSNGNISLFISTINEFRNPAVSNSGSGIPAKSIPVASLVITSCFSDCFFLFVLTHVNTGPAQTKRSPASGYPVPLHARENPHRGHRHILRLLTEIQSGTAKAIQ